MENYTTLNENLPPGRVSIPYLWSVILMFCQISMKIIAYICKRREITFYRSGTLLFVLDDIEEQNAHSMRQFHFITMTYPTYLRISDIDMEI